MRSTISSLPSWRRKCWASSPIPPVTNGAAEEVPASSIVMKHCDAPASQRKAGAALVMSTPGAARQNSLAIPQRLEKSAIVPCGLVATTASEWPRSSGSRTGSPGRISTELADTGDPSGPISPWALPAAQT